MRNANTKPLAKNVLLIKQDGDSTLAQAWGPVEPHR